MPAPKNKNRIEEAIRSAKAIVTWASYFGDNYHLYNEEQHRTNLTHIMDASKEIVELLNGVNDD